MKQQTARKCGVAQTMRQGKGPTAGSTATSGDVTKTMRQGSRKGRGNPAGKLGTVMHQ